MATKTRRATFSEDELGLMIEVLSADITERQGQSEELALKLDKAQEELDAAYFQISPYERVEGPLATAVSVIESTIGGHNYRLRKRTELRTRLIDELGKAK